MDVSDMKICNALFSIGLLKAPGARWASYGLPLDESINKTLFSPYSEAKRKITDNIIIAQEIIHSMRIKKGKK
ncbi:Retrovirus-related Pol polyprotein LINE-1 [Gossypium australe]|uniref:Retrovirus-related Pol polyprotein LINE-1 n=1 Tax=Gossypium australe TaxID=47621 RepID=A0A5B6VY77_9ROSI|nr:Retrovirus-related Pol polyprotein LINE-1 [Gossypium australe]